MKTKMLMSLLMFLLCVGLQGEVLANLVSNPSFEDGTTDWTHELAGVTDSTDGYYSGLITRSGWVTSAYFDTTPGTDYVLSFDARRTNEDLVWDGTNLHIMVSYGWSPYVYLDGTVDPGWPALYPTLFNGWYPDLVWYTYTTQWHHIEVEFTATHTGHNITLYAQNMPTNQNILLDNFVVEEAGGGANLVSNPSFEDGTTDWTHELAGVTDSTDGYYSGLITRSGWVTSTHFDTTPGTDYVLSFDARRTNEDLAWDGLNLHIMVSYGMLPQAWTEYYVYLDGTVDPGWPALIPTLFNYYPSLAWYTYHTDWHHFELEFTATWTSHNVTLYAQNMPPNQNILLDNFVVEEAPVPEVVDWAIRPNRMNNQGAGNNAIMTALVWLANADLATAEITDVYINDTPAEKVNVDVEESKVIIKVRRKDVTHGSYTVELTVDGTELICD